MTEASFWIGLLIAIPLSILANILTPRAQKWLDRRSETKQSKRAGTLRSEHAQVAALVEDQRKLHTYLLMVVVRATYIGSLVGIITGLIWAVNSFISYNEFISGAAQILAVFGAIMIVRVCGEGMQVALKVQNYPSYKERVEKQLGQPIAQQGAQADGPASGGPAA